MGTGSAYPEMLRRTLGVRHTAACELHSGQRRFSHPVLLWSDEPFDAAGVERALRDLGWREVTVPTPAPPGSTWWRALVDGEPSENPLCYVGRAGANSPTGFLVGYWSGRSETMVIFHLAEERWLIASVNDLLYDKDDDPRDWVFLLTRGQAEALCLAEGRPLITDAEVDALLRADRDARQAFWWRRDRFYDHRAGRFRAAAAEMRAAAGLRADDPPARQPVDGRDEAARVAAEIPPVPVRLGESFPLLRFLVGYFRDRASYREHPGAYQVHCNRLALALPGEGVLDLALHLGMAPTSVFRDVVTPFLPVEADYRSDPGLADLDPPEGRNLRLGYKAFPVSPANMSIVGRSGAETTLPGRVEGLGLVLTFPGDLEYIIGPEDHSAVYFHLGGACPFDREKGAAVGPSVALHVPDSIDLIKTVRARLVRHPGAGRPRSAL
jgi:hypothetical protein